jgi:hypothetical protein
MDSCTYTLRQFLGSLQLSSNPFFWKSYRGRVLHKLQLDPRFSELISNWATDMGVTRSGVFSKADELSFAVYLFERGEWEKVQTLADQGADLSFGAGLYNWIQGVTEEQHALDLAQRLSTPRRINDTPPIGVSFRPRLNARTMTGVDPGTLIPSKDFDSFQGIVERGRMEYQQTQPFAQALKVTSRGVVLDGNHRLLKALKEGNAVDVVITEH